ncbi:hypothetical protein PG994_000825 [Apiospora phragmitis]|uniref:DUF4334 domain-containing protein n=1 Tax=Apiospora phragmitis TaxID=2905665 RepID=A0ABR1X798_9PEZI
MPTFQHAVAAGKVTIVQAQELFDTLAGHGALSPGRVRAGSPGQVRKPGARLRPVEYRGVVTASMVYHQVPIIDHFRRVDGDTLLSETGLVADSLCRAKPAMAFARALLQAHAAEEKGRHPIILMEGALVTVGAETERFVLDLVKDEFTGKGFTVVMAGRDQAAIARGGGRYYPALIACVPSSWVSERAGIRFRMVALYPRGDLLIL